MSTVNRRVPSGGFSEGRANSVTAAEQGRVFLAMTLIGAGLGGLLQGLLLLCRMGGVGALLRAAAELSFGICCAAAIAAGALQLRTEAFRWYVFAGAAAGMLVYGATIGLGVGWLADKIGKKVGIRAKRGKDGQENAQKGRN